jgi:hypothetical protein
MMSHRRYLLTLKHAANRSLLAPSPRNDRFSSNITIAFHRKSEIIFNIGHSNDKKHSYKTGKQASLGSGLLFL